MKNKILLLFVPALLLMGMLVNSCKKNEQSTIEALFTKGRWQLSTITVTTSIGDSTNIDTLNTNCDSTQFFTFNNDKTCSYTNFHCKAQPIAKGRWTLSDDQLYLLSDMVCQDTTAAGSSKPFASAQIFNVGQYSLVLRTGDLQNYSTTKRRVVYRYGFIRERQVTN